jgi:LPXTG-motif cell wall-anchored protein
MEKKMKSILKYSYSWKKITSRAALLLAGVMSLSLGGISAAQAEDLISSVSSANCSTTSGYTVTLGGNFTSPILNVWVQGETFDIQIPGTDWSQTPTSVVVKIPASASSTFMIRTYNGGAVLEKEFKCTEAVVIVPPVTDTEDVTEDGGLLPDTATNNYNYLVAGLGLALVGSAGLLRRRVIKE